MTDQVDIEAVEKWAESGKDVHWTIAMQLCLELREARKEIEAQRELYRKSQLVSIENQSRLRLNQDIELQEAREEIRELQSKLGQHTFCLTVNGLKESLFHADQEIKMQEMELEKRQKRIRELEEHNKDMGIEQDLSEP